MFNADTRTVSLKISHQPALAERWSTVQSQQAGLMFAECSDMLELSCCEAVAT